MEWRNDKRIYIILEDVKNEFDCEVICCYNDIYI